MKSIGDEIAEDFSNNKRHLDQFEAQYLARQIDDRIYGRSDVNRLYWMFYGSGEWTAQSKLLADERDPFTYKIEVCDDGTFSVKSTDPELKPNPRDWVRCFDTLAVAKAFCWRNEASVVQGKQS